MANGIDSTAPGQLSVRGRDKAFDRVSIYQRGKKWQVIYSFEGKQIRKSLGTKNKKVAERKARIIDAQLIEGIHQPKKQAPLITEAIGLYAALLTAKGARPATLKRYKPELQRILEFAATQHIFRVSGLNRSFFDAFRVWRSSQVKSSTLYHELVLLKQFVNFLASRELIQGNPLKNEKLKKPKYGGQACYSRKQVEDLIRAAKPPFSHLFAVLAYSGMRINEALHLTWKDINFETGFIYIRAKPDWVPKTGEERKVPIFDEIRPLLESLRKPDGLVFVGGATKKYPQGGRPIVDRGALSALKRALKRIGLAAGTVHSFRHAFVSMCANDGIPPLVAARWTGHTTISMHQSYYNLSDEESLKQMRKLRPSPADDGKPKGADKPKDEGQSS